MTMPIPERIAAARAGNNSAVICRVPSGWAVMCDMQFLRGYTILLADPPVVSINDLMVLWGIPIPTCMPISSRVTCLSRKISVWGCPGPTRKRCGIQPYSISNGTRN